MATSAEQYDLDLNTLNSSGINCYNIVLSNPSLWESYHFPDYVSGVQVLCDFKNANVGFQICHASSGGLYMRHKWSTSSEWGAWGRCDGFGCADASSLASLLGAPYPRVNFTGDADDFAYGTAYVEPATCSNIPQFSGYIIAFSPYTIANSNVRFQMMIAKGAFAYRVKDFKSTWEPWVVISS